MKSIYTLLAIALPLLCGCNLDSAFADSYPSPKIVYGEDLKPCVADSENMVAYSHYEEGKLS